MNQVIMECRLGFKINNNLNFILNLLINYLFKSTYDSDNDNRFYDNCVS